MPPICRYVEINDAGLVVERGKEGAKRLQTLEVDAVVLCAGQESLNSLFHKVRVVRLAEANLIISYHACVCARTADRRRRLTAARVPHWRCAGGGGARCKESHRPSEYYLLIHAYSLIYLFMPQ